ncbi:hypothetical protein LG314_09535 [Agrococcus terreus]|uniref:hypothetical protein n=1 Tax=Agrococcus terreus TaxID=574649 RepID=UPI00384FAB50
MDPLEVAQLVLRIALALAFVLLGLSRPVWRIRKALIETVIPSAVVGRADGAVATRRMLGVANALLATSVVGGLAMLAPWEAVRVAGALVLAALVLAALVLALGAQPLAGLRRHWAEPAFRGELALQVVGVLALPAALVLSVL